MFLAFLHVGWGGAVVNILVWYFCRFYFYLLLSKNNQVINDQTKPRNNHHVQIYRRSPLSRGGHKLGTSPKRNFADPTQIC